MKVVVVVCSNPLKSFLLFDLQRLVIVMLLTFPLSVIAATKNANDVVNVNIDGSSNMVMPSGKLKNDYSAISEQNKFYGLAFYYNDSKHFIVGPENIKILESNKNITLGGNEWFAAVGRFNVLVVKSSGALIKVGAQSFEIKPPTKSDKEPEYYIVTKPQLESVALELEQLRYSHLWAPLATLTKFVEWALSAIQKNIVNNWGLVIIVFALLLKILLLPVSIMTVHFQRKVSQHQAILVPQIAEIAAHHDAEEAHKQIMAAHKALNISPFYTLKPMLGLFIQIPVLVAVFNALGEMPQFMGASFLWINDLAYPDVIASLPMVIPFFGDKVSLLPFLMTVVTLCSTIIFQNKYAPVTEVRRQKRNLYVMAAVFFILFYPFPAAMVLYWTISNVLHILQQYVVKI